MKGTTQQPSAAHIVELLSGLLAKKELGSVDDVLASLSEENDLHVLTSALILTKPWQGVLPRRVIAVRRMAELAVEEGPALISFLA